MDQEATNTEYYNQIQKQISSLIRLNQQLLLFMFSISHPVIDDVHNLTNSLYDHFQCSTKITGAGGGGCIFTFLERRHVSSSDDKDDDDNIQERIQSVIRAIENLNTTTSKDDSADSRNLTSFTSIVGSSGVLWA